MLVIEMIGGNCPVQADGTVNGKPFYFRARGEHWSMGIGGDPVADPEWYRRQPWGDTPFEAGWMPFEIARGFIETCADDYMKGLPP